MDEDIRSYARQLLGVAHPFLPASPQEARGDASDTRYTWRYGWDGEDGHGVIIYGSRTTLQRALSIWRETGLLNDFTHVGIESIKVTGLGRIQLSKRGGLDAAKLDEGRIRQFLYVLRRELAEHGHAFVEQWDPAYSDVLTGSY
jgi:hypothetical protein